MEDDLLTIREAAELLGVSVDTLRRWDRSGKLPAMRKKGGTHRYYARRDLELTGSDLLELASEWAFVEQALPRDYYCEYSSVFQQRLVRMQDELMRSGVEEGLLSLIVAVAGEIGNNSYDHNIGNWPDVPGTFFGFRVKQGDVVLADRGLGVLHTLKAVKPDLDNHVDALRVAFTEIVSGRSPEARGNGLKFVRSVVGNHPLSLFFQSGDAELRMRGEQPDLHITRSPVMIRGCLARVTF